MMVVVDYHFLEEKTYVFCCLRPLDTFEFVSVASGMPVLDKRQLNRRVPFDPSSSSWDRETQWDSAFFRELQASTPPAAALLFVCLCWGWGPAARLGDRWTWTWRRKNINHEIRRCVRKLFMYIFILIHIYNILYVYTYWYYFIRIVCNCSLRRFSMICGLSQERAGTGLEPRWSQEGRDQGKAR